MSFYIKWHEILNNVQENYNVVKENIKNKIFEKLDY